MLDENGDVVGVVTFKVAEGTADNLNFALPINYARGMLSTHDLLTLGELSSRLGTTSDLFSARTTSNGRRWKSLNSGTVKVVKSDGDYLYVETVMPAGAPPGDFAIAQLKKAGDKYTGTSNGSFLCSYTRGLGVYATERTNRCPSNEPIEITLFTPNRIEGRTNLPDPKTKFNCGECKYDHALVMRPFVWIPE